MTDAGERTEKATPRRIKDVREKGQLSTSKDLLAWVGMGAAVVMIPGTIERGTQAGIAQLETAALTAASPDAETVLTALADGLASMAGVLTPLFAVVVVAVVAAAAVQGGIHFRRFKAHSEQFDVVKGLGRMFGRTAIWEGVKALLKTAVVGLVLFCVVSGLMPVLSQAGGLPLGILLGASVDGTGTLLWCAVVAGLAVAGIDVIVVIRRNRSKTLMTKKEVRDETKNAEGDPLVKSQRRARALSLSRNRMIASVATADVVLVNPTHVAVALRYEAGKSAPRLVAKGQGVIAARIREEAERHRVAIVRDIPLARALHGACTIGQEIPVELYSAVAKVLAFVLALKNRGAQAGTHVVPALASASGGIR